MGVGSRLSAVALGEGIVPGRRRSPQVEEKSPSGRKIVLGSTNPTPGRKIRPQGRRIRPEGRKSDPRVEKQTPGSKEDRPGSKKNRPGSKEVARGRREDEMGPQLWDSYGGSPRRIPYLSTPAVATGFRYIRGTTDFRQNIGNGSETSGYSSPPHPLWPLVFNAFAAPLGFQKKSGIGRKPVATAELSECRCGDNGRRVPHLSTPAVATGFQYICGTTGFSKNIGNSLETNGYSRVVGVPLWGQWWKSSTALHTCCSHCLGGGAGGRGGGGDLRDGIGGRGRERRRRAVQRERRGGDGAAARHRDGGRPPPQGPIMPTQEARAYGGGRQCNEWGMNKEEGAPMTL
eukprot:gene8028-biopygen4146